MVVVGAMMAAAVAVVVWTSRTRHCIASSTCRIPSGGLPCAAVRITQEVVYHTPEAYHTVCVLSFLEPQHVITGGVVNAVVYLVCGINLPLPLPRLFFLTVFHGRASSFGEREDVFSAGLME